MRALSAMVLGSALLLQPATAGAQGGRETIVAQFDEAVKLYESRGYRPDPGAVPTGAVIGLLAADSRAYLEVRLERGVEYLIEGFCDEDCDDLDLALVSADGDEVVRDGGDDDVPELVFVAPESGRYYLGVSMITCSTDLCYFGYRILRK